MLQLLVSVIKKVVFGVELGKRSPPIEGKRHFRGIVTCTEQGRVSFDVALPIVVEAMGRVDPLVWDL